MTAKHLRVSRLRVAAVAGAFAVAAGVLTACNDSSTASAPIGGESMTTTTVPAGDTSSSEEAEASADASAGASRASKSRPATAPDSSTSVVKKFPGGAPPPEGVKLSAKEKKYLAALKRQKVEFMGDSDNNVALTMGRYVCQSEANKVDPMLMKAYVRASIGPVAKSEADANSKSDKIISAAEKHLC